MKQIKLMKTALLAFIVVALVVVGVLVMPKPKPAQANVSYYIHVYVCWEPDVVVDWDGMGNWPVRFTIEQVDYDKSTGGGGTAVTIVSQLPIEVGANNSYTFYLVPTHHARPEVR